MPVAWRFFRLQCAGLAPHSGDMDRHEMAFIGELSAEWKQLQRSSAETTGGNQAAE
jgi:hypothetical protein